MPLFAGSAGVVSFTANGIYTDAANLLVIVLTCDTPVGGTAPICTSQIPVGAGLAFTQVAQINTPNGGAYDKIQFQVFIAPVSAPLVNASLTFTCSTNVTNFDTVGIAAFGLVGYSGLDGGSMSLPLPAFDTHPPTGGGAAGVTFATTDASDLILFIQNTFSTLPPTTPPGWTTELDFVPFAGARALGTTIASLTPGTVLNPGGVASTNTSPAGPTDNYVVGALAFKGGLVFATVPDVVGEAQADAEADIVAANLIVGAETFAIDGSIPVGHVVSQSPSAGSTVVEGTAVALVLSLGAATVVPDIVGMQRIDADAAIIAARLVTGSVVGQFDLTAPVGQVLSQSPAAGTSEDPGVAVSYVVSNGPPPAAPNPTIPNIVALTPDQATIGLAQTGYTTGIVTFAPSNKDDKGRILSQSPRAYTPAALGAPVSYVVSSGPPLTVPFDFEQTVISQYFNSPTLLQLVTNMNEYIRQDVNFQAFYDFVWNVDTAQGFGLDYWGRIVDISRLLQIPNAFDLFGFENSDTPPGVLPFNQGVFNVPGGGVTQSFLLPDDSYRTLILVKALANISATTAPAINQLLRNLFPGRGAAYVLDLGNMRMQFTFEFDLTPTEFAILSQSNALPHPAGVLVSIVTIAGSGLFGFAEGLPNSESFGNGTFYQP